MKIILNNLKTVIQKNKFLVFVSITIILIIIIFILSFIFIKRSNIDINKQSNDLSEATSNITPTPIVTAGIVVNDMSVLRKYSAGNIGFTLSNNNMSVVYENYLYTIHEGVVYNPTVGINSKASKTISENTNDNDIYALADIPNEAKSIGVAPDVWIQKAANNNNFIVSISWLDDIKGSYNKNYYYDSLSNTITDITSWINPYNERINAIEILDPSGDYGLFLTNNCVGDCPSKAKVVNLKSHNIATLNQTVYFKWLENGKYEYKEYSSGTSNIDKIPLKSGNI